VPDACGGGPPTVTGLLTHRERLSMGRPGVSWSGTDGECVRVFSHGGPLPRSWPAPSAAARALSIFPFSPAAQVCFAPCALPALRLSLLYDFHFCPFSVHRSTRRADALVRRVREWSAARSATLLRVGGSCGGIETAVGGWVPWRCGAIERGRSVRRPVARSSSRLEATCGLAVVEVRAVRRQASVWRVICIALV